jgi:TRAP-type mannitol/chloroaromatic compound transport system permease small subunit
LNGLARAIDALNRSVGRLVAVATLLMVLVGAFNALARYFDRDLGTSWSSNRWIELQWYLFSLVFLLGAPWTLARQRHVRVDVLYGRLSPRARAWVDLLGGVVFLLPFCLFALWSGYEPVANSFAVREGSPDPNGLPRWPIKAVLLVAFALLALQGVSEIAKRIAFLFGDGPDPTGDTSHGPGA